MYPTVNALLGSWDILTAETVEWVDATDEVRALLGTVYASSCFQKDLWRQLCFFAEVMPNQDVLPLRTRYDGRNLGIGVNHVTSARPLVYAGPDLVSSAILTGKSPEVTRAWKLAASGKQTGLRPVQLADGVVIDPREEDLFKRLIELRKSLPARGLDPIEEARLSQFLKTVANSGGYGVFAQSNVREYSRDRELIVHGLHEVQTRSRKTENPGPFSYPPVAALTTAAARLMLALLEHSVQERGGGYAFCDTDSMAIAGTVDSGQETIEGHRVLLWSEVQEIVTRFEQLNPYDPERLGQNSILEIEAENYEGGEPRQLYVYAVSAKRYAFLTRDESGRFVVIKASEHGLGHLMNPLDPDSEDRDWIRQAFQWWLDREMGLSTPEPEWLDRPALGRVSLSSPVLMKPFKASNQGKPYDEQVKPFNFLLAATVAPFGHPVEADPEKFRLVAPFSRDVSAWRSLAWRNAYTGDAVWVTTAHPAPPDSARILTMRQVLEKHFAHPEAKSADGAGQPCGPATEGLLQRRNLQIFGVEYIGKESHRWEEVEGGVPPDPEEAVQCFYDGANQLWNEVIVPAMHGFTAAQLSGAAGVSARHIQNLRNGHTSPSAQVRQLLTEWTLARLFPPSACPSPSAACDAGPSPTSEASPGERLPSRTLPDIE